MGLKEIFTITRGTKKVLMICLMVATAIVVAAFFHYRGLNRSEDPALIKAAKFVSASEKSSAAGDNTVAFIYLDSAMAVLKTSRGFESSYEPGIIHNNRAGILIMQALYYCTNDSSEKKALLRSAMNYCDSAINIYSRWIAIWGSLDEKEVRNRLYSGVKPVQATKGSENKILKRKVNRVLDAVTETPRRLSVAYTNKATVYRHLLQPDSSLACLNKALSLWEDNHTARSNLSVLTGGKPVKPGILRTLFPPERIKRNKFDM